MNIPSEDLFLLIQSLSKSEKRSFKLSASMDKKEKQYITLFDLIVKQKKYDEEALVKNLKVERGAFAVYKNHLYRLLLERVSAMHSSKEEELRNLLTQADFLYSKGLYPHYEKMLRKAKKFAYAHEMDNPLLEILSMEHRNAWRKRDLKNAEAVMEEDKQILRRVNNQRQYTHLSNEIIVGLSSMGDKRNKQDVKKIKVLMKNPLMKNDKNALTFKSKYSLYHTLSLYHSVNDSPEKQYHYAKKATELYESHPEKIKHDTFTYLLSVHLMLVACHSLKRYDEVKKYTDKLNVDPASLTNERERIWAFFTYYDTTFDYYIKTGNFSEGIPLVEKLIKEFDKYAPKLEDSHITVLAFHIARIYFGAENFSKCLLWLNKILNEKYILNARPGFENNIRLLYLIVHYEKGNYDLLASLAKSTHHDLLSKGLVYKFESAMLDFFGKINHKKNKGQAIKELKKLKSEIENILKDKNEKMPYEEFDYTLWIESKIENKSFAEIVRKKSSV